MKEVLFCLPSKLTVAFAILGNHPIIVPTCCSKAIFKVTPKCTHGCRAQLLRDDTLLLHPQPEEVQLWESYRNKDFCNLVLHINSEGMQQFCPP